MTWRPITWQRLAAELAEALAARPGTVRVAVDGPACAAPDALADSLVEPLRTLGRPAVHLRGRWFWRDASLRLEHGHRDVESYPDWLDVDAVRREVLVPVADTGRFLPSLRDPDTDRSTRAAPATVAPGTVLIVSGEFLLGRGLPFEHTVHLSMSPAARARRIAAADAWTLPAHDRYDAATKPSDVADTVLRVEDPKRPAVRDVRASRA